MRRRSVRTRAGLVVGLVAVALAGGSTARGQPAAAGDPAALRACLETFGYSDVGEKIPGYVDVDIMTNDGVPLRELVVAFGSERRGRLAVGVRVAAANWPGHVVARGEGGGLAWAAVGPVQGGPSFGTPAREARTDQRVRAIVARCGKAYGRPRPAGPRPHGGVSRPVLPARASSRRWQITDLGTLGGGSSEAVAMNERGQIVGTAATADEYGDPHAVLWQAGRATDLGALGGFTSEAVAINRRGQIIGNRITRSGQSRALLWEAGHMVDLRLNAGSESRAVAINSHGEIIGTHEEAVGGAVLWRGGRAVDLPLKSVAAINDQGQVIGGRDVWQAGRTTDLNAKIADVSATAINSKGQVVGTRTVPHKYLDTKGAFLWHGGMHDLPAAGVRTYCVPVDLNDRGDVVGRCGIPVGTQGPTTQDHAVVWRNGRSIDLGTLGGDASWSSAAAVNDHGQVIGMSQTGDKRDAGRWHAFIWERGRLTDLGILPGGNESVAIALNENSQIIGWSTNRAGQRRAVLWTLRPPSK